jgi:hypothetical protein
MTSRPSEAPPPLRPPPVAAPRFDVTGVKISRKGTALRLLLAAILPFSVAVGLKVAPFTDVLLELAVGLLLASAAVFVGAPASPAALLIEGDHLVIQRSRRRSRIPLEGIALGLILPERNTARTPGSSADPLLYHVQIELKNGNILRVQTETMAEASAFLEAARLDPSQRRLSLRIRRAMRQLVAGLFVAPLVFFGGTAALSFALMALLPTVAKVPLFFAAMAAVAVGLGILWRAFMSAEVTIGSDGIVVRQRFGKRFIPYPELRDIVEHGSDIELRYRDGTSEVIPGDIDEPARRAALVRRMRDAMESGASAHARTEALARNGRPIAAWREALIRMLDGGTGYRSASLTRDDALAVVRDAGARTEHRIAAALALSASEDAAVKERIRVAAQACAREQVRIALEQAAGGEIDEEALDQALREEQAR